jgi:putative drug exporter of the RND superfamily
MLAPLARACMRHKWIVIGSWLALLIVINAVSGAIGPDYKTNFRLPNSETKQVFDLLQQHAPNQAGTTGQIVVKADEGFANDPAAQAALQRITDFAADQPGVTVTTPEQNPQQVSQNGQIVFAQLDISDRSFTDLSDLGTKIMDFGDEQAAPPGVQIEYGGDPFSKFELPESEVLGIIAAVIILIVAFGSVLAMGLPIGVALFGLGIATAGVGLISHVIEMPDFTISMVAMIGLGVGIDYALFIVTRYREGLRLGLSVEDAVAEAIDTSGRAVLFAGTTVIIALMGLSLMGLAFVQGMAIASSLGVLLMVLGSLTLLPALLGWVGTRIDQTSRAALIAVGVAVIGAIVGFATGQGAIFAVGFLAAILLFGLSFLPPFKKTLRELIPHRAERPKEARFWYRWSRSIQHRPWPFAIGTVVVLLALAAPLTSIRLGFGDNGNYPADTTVRKAYDLLAEGFGPGTNGPLLVVVQGDAANDQAQLGQFVDAVKATPDVATAFVSGEPQPGFALVTVFPQSAPQDAATTSLVHQLRDHVIPDAGVDAKIGGQTPGSIDFATYLGNRMPLLIGVVLLLSFLLLMAVFRSVLVPLKAVVMNLLSVGAAYGILVAIFQWGWGLSLIGVDKAGPIEAWVPMFLFAIVFGLSMDYEVFLLSRIKEEYDRTRDNATAVADGLAATARVITAAAIIMFCVFGAFALGDNRQLKLFGLGLAIAVLVDATLVRMVLVPSTMELLGDKNWWIPRWLNKILPRIHVEGTHHVAPIPESALEGEGPDGRPKEPELV